MDGQKSPTTSNFAVVDPENVMLGSSNDFAVITVVTKMGAEYKFPDMSEGEVRKALPESGRVPSNQPAIMMVNVSGSVMSVLFQIVKEVRIGEEVVWACPA